MKSKDKNPFESPTQSELIDRYVDGLEQKEKAIYHTVKYKPHCKRRGLNPFILITSILLIFAITLSLFYFDVVSLPKNLFTGEEEPLPLAGSTYAAAPSPTADHLISLNSTESSAVRPSKLFGVTLTPEKDFKPETVAADLTEIAAHSAEKGFTAVFISLNAQSGLITDTPEVKAGLEAGLKACHESTLSTFITVDISALCTEDVTSIASVKIIKDTLLSLCELAELDGIMLKGVERRGYASDFKDYLSAGTLFGFEQYKRDKLTRLVAELSATLRAKKEGLLLGLITDSVYATDQELEGGMKVDSAEGLYSTKNADVIDWMEKRLFDIVFVDACTSTESKTLPFNTIVEWWHNNAPAVCDLAFTLTSEKAVNKEAGFKNPDQMGRQLKALSDINRFVFCFDSYTALKNDKSGGAELVYKYLINGVDDGAIMRQLSITSPQKTDFTTYENSISIIGASDPNFELLLNGKAVERTEDGYFSLQIDLKTGKNSLTFTHKGSSKTFNITYRYVIIKDYSPTSSLSMDGGDTLMVKVTARNGSTVTATLGDTTVTLKMTEDEQYSDFCTYTGGITLPAGGSSNKNIGKIKFKGTHSGISESFSGGSITVKKKEPEPSYTPSTGDYIAVGNTLIAEVTKYQVETFDGDKIDDLSQPYNNYLPAGTLDYCDESTVYDPSSGNSYRTLRYGKRVYSKNSIRTLRGTLPETNSVKLDSLVTDGRYTTLVLETDWKAPFRLELLPQKYAAATGSERGNITSATFNYIDITFCYAATLKGDFEDIESSPVFSRAQLIKNASDYTLRLYLKKTGVFYGWTANYDKDGNLVFEFLNPAKVEKADNEYGARLDGTVIVLDPGHGGSDPGAVGSVLGNNKEFTESNRCLLLANKIKTKLESLGARVVMTRSTDVSLTQDTRILAMKNAKPDLAISIHRNAATSSAARGFGSYHFNAYTKAAAKIIADATAKQTFTSGDGEQSVYTRTFTKWHVFYMSRMTDCPVVLTENGFMSNAADFSNIRSDAWNEKCAEAMVQGIVDYFLSIN